MLTVEDFYYYLEIGCLGSKKVKICDYEDVLYLDKNLNSNCKEDKCGSIFYWNYY